MRHRRWNGRSIGARGRRRDGRAHAGRQSRRGQLLLASSTEKTASDGFRPLHRWCSRTRCASSGSHRPRRASGSSWHRTTPGLPATAGALIAELPASELVLKATLGDSTLPLQVKFRGDSSDSNDIYLVDLATGGSDPERAYPPGRCACWRMRRLRPRRRQQIHQRRQRNSVREAQAARSSQGQLSSLGDRFSGSGRHGRCRCSVRVATQRALSRD